MPILRSHSVRRHAATAACAPATRVCRWLAGSALLALPLASQGQLTPAAQVEIQTLLRAIGTSGCEFQRGSTWYEATKAEAHLTKKYEYMAARNMLASTEEFIAKAATSSAMSGDPYSIRCGASAPAQKSDVWLRSRLKTIREGGKNTY